MTTQIEITGNLDKLDTENLNLAAQDILLEEIAERRAFLCSIWENHEDPDEELEAGLYDQELVQAAINLNEKYYWAAISHRSDTEYTKVIELYKLLNSDILKEDFKYVAKLK
jgi:hypothetical protein